MTLLALLNLNTRELAFIIWVIVFAVCTPFLKGIAKQAKEVVQQLFQKEILFATGVIILFAGCCVSILFSIGSWDTSLCKDTLVWFFTVPFLTMFNSRKVSEDTHYFGNTVKELFAFSAIADYLINAYTFSLPVELLLMFFTFFFTLLLTYFEKIFTNSFAHKLFKNSLFLVGLIMVGDSLIQLIIHFKQFASWETLNTFLLPQILTLLYLPLLFLILLYMEYHFSFKLLPRAIADEHLLKKAKTMAILNFGPNWRAVKRWRGNIFKHGNIDNFSELQETFRRHQALRKQEKNPPHIPVNEGWSPYRAKNFLRSDNISTGHYDRMHEDNYFATSEYKILNTGNILPDTMVYTIEGDMKISTKLQLTFTIHAPFHEEKDDAILYYTKGLCNNAVHKALSIDMEIALMTRQSRSYEDELYRYTTESQNFVKAENGYVTSFSITLKKAAVIPKSATVKN